MKVIGLTTRCMEEESTTGRMGESMRESINTTKSTDSDLTPGLTEEGMSGSG